MGQLMRAVFYRELLDIVLERKFVYLILLFSLLVMLSFYIGSRDFLRLLDEERLAITMQEENLRNQPGGYDLLAILGVKLYRPPSKLDVVTKGLELRVGRVAAINAYANIELSDPGPNETSISNLFDYLDLTFIVRILLSFVALLYAQEIISREKEIGTLRHCLSNPIGRSGWLIAKCAARILILFTSVLIPVGIGVLALQLFVPELRFSNEEFLRFALTILIYMLYAGFHKI
jgi:ABC-type transport system involved in multi-copper enzyme maturation permease subunit